MVDVTQLHYISQQVSIYFGILILISGVIGNILNLLIFISVRTTFATNSCSLYFATMAVVDLLIMLISCVTRILSFGFGIDPTLTSVGFCKFRTYFANTAPLLSNTLTCLAAITQFLSTSRNVNYRQKATVRVARWAIMLANFFWILHGLPHLVFYNIRLSPTTYLPVCISTNFIFSQYVTWAVYNVLIFVVPTLILLVFGYLTYRNILLLNRGATNQPRNAKHRINRQLTAVSDTSLHLLYSCTSFLLRYYERCC